MEFETQEAAAEFYGVSLRALKGYLKRGKEAGDPFPVGNPVAVVEWYGRTHGGRKVPAALVEAATRGAVVEEVSPGPLFDVQTQVPVMVGSGSMEGEVARARRLAALFGTQAETMLSGIKDLPKEQQEAARVEAVRMNGRWQEALEAMRHVEKVSQELAIKRGELIPRTAVVVEWTNLHAALPGALRIGLMQARPEGVEEGVWAKAVRAAMDEAMRLLPEKLPELLDE